MESINQCKPVAKRDGSSLDEPPVANKVNHINEADSDLFCPFAFMCGYDTNTTPRLRRHLIEVHAKTQKSTFNCIFSSCHLLQPSQNLKEYSNHLRTVHSDDIKKALAALRQQNAKSSDIFVKQKFSIMENKCNAVNDNNSREVGTFLIHTDVQNSPLQSAVIKTSSDKIIHGAKKNGFFVAPLPPLSNSSKVPSVNGSAITNTVSDATRISSPTVDLFHSNQALEKKSLSTICYLPQYSEAHSSLVLQSSEEYTTNKYTNRQGGRDEHRKPENHGERNKMLSAILEDIDDEISSTSSSGMSKNDAITPNLATKTNNLLKEVKEECKMYSSLSLSYLVNRYKSGKSEENQQFPYQQIPPLLPLHQCKICNKILRSKGGLKQHMSLVHNNVPLTCTICNAFSTRSRLAFARHQKNHFQYPIMPYSRPSS